MKLGIRNEKRPPFAVAESPAAEGHSHLAGDLELSVPLYSLTLKQGLLVPLLVIAKLSPAVFIDCTARYFNSAIIAPARLETMFWCPLCVKITYLVERT